MPSGDCHLLDFLKRTKSSDSSFVFNPAISDEVKLEISCIQNNKSHGIYSSPTQLLKHLIRNVIRDNLAENFKNNYLYWSTPQQVTNGKDHSYFQTR